MARTLEQRIAEMEKHQRGIKTKMERMQTVFDTNAKILQRLQAERAKQAKRERDAAAYRAGIERRVEQCLQMNGKQTAKEESF